MAGRSGSSFVSGGVYLNVDLGDVARVIELLRGVLTREQFERLLHRTFNEVGKRSKTVIAREVVRDYAVTQGWVKKGIGHYQLSTGGGVTCKIPLTGRKGGIGSTFKASGGRRIRARIVRGSISTLPQVMNNQGGNPPFMYKGMAFTRRTKEHLPIVRVKGLAVPQMPLNRSAEDIQDWIIEYTGKRIEHNFMHMFG